jgi:phenylalanyl-tRNA synthetase beta chain
MLVPLSWLKEYTDIPADAAEFAARMVMSGSNIETVSTFGQDIKNVVIGRILSVAEHRDSDHLIVCMADVGAAAEDGAPIQIVTGAPNVREGILVPIALHGSQLPGGMKIKKGKLRGVESNGMLCSAGELGFDDKVAPLLHKDGIWILPDEFTVGEDVVTAMGLDETVVDFEITPNRPDCRSILGMAREAAATFESNLRYPDTACGVGEPAAGGRTAADFIRVEIRKPELCARYVARVAEDIVIQESPWWLQRRLMFAGTRPINNIVDITNYVMLEYGHPIHAFDIRTIAGGTIIVDTATEGASFTTLDGNERNLSADMLLINDGEKGVAVAGIMGGLNSEIEADTTTILVEAANFNRSSVRLTAKRLGIRSEASSRFEKGVSAELSGDAADRVCALIAEIGAGRVVSGVVDNYPEQVSSPSIKIRAGRMNKILGTDLSREEIGALLKRLEISVVQDPGDSDGLLVCPPAVRIDLKEETDYSEEVGRIYGYDRLDTTTHKDNVEAGRSDSWRWREKTRDMLCGMGLSEIQTYSFVSPKGVDEIALPLSSPKRNFVKLINPLGEENSVMRTLLLPNMLEALARNYSRSIPAARAFEIGNTFLATAPVQGEGLAAASKDDGGLPTEALELCIGAYDAAWDFFTMKGVVTEILTGLGIHKVNFSADASPASWHPGRCARIDILRQDEALPIGFLGQIHPMVCETFGITTPVYGAVLALETVFGAANMARTYSPLPRYPAAERDISLLAAEDVTVGEIETIIRKGGGKRLEQVALFDVYRGKQIPEGMKSLSFNLVYRDADKTLTDEEVTGVHEKILSALKEKTGAALREV